MTAHIDGNPDVVLRWSGGKLRACPETVKGEEWLIEWTRTGEVVREGDNVRGFVIRRDVSPDTLIADAEKDGVFMRKPMKRTP